jgi:hypothetical protein
MQSSSSDREMQTHRDGYAREMQAAHRWIRLGYKPIAIGDDEVRSKFQVTGKCADLIFQNRPHTCIVADAKGASIGTAIEQLSNTIKYVKQHYAVVEPLILIHGPARPAALQALGSSCHAQRRKTGDYALLDANGSLVTTPTHVVILIEFW